MKEEIRLPVVTYEVKRKIHYPLLLLELFLSPNYTRFPVSAFIWDYLTVKIEFGAISHD